MTAVEYVSFDGSTRIATRAAAPDRYRFWDKCTSSRCGISRGAGLSYAAASFSGSGRTVEHRHFNRLLDFDSATGVVEVETGVTLGQVYGFAAARGFFLPVQPGHPSITIGGCIAPDVHGKNQLRDGTFLSVVESLRLFHPSHGVLELSREHDAGLFHLTVGGCGLTGNILSARIRLAPVRSLEVAMTLHPLETMEQLPQALADGSSDSDLIYSWHDLTSTGNGFGRGFVCRGSFLPGGEPPPAERRERDHQADRLASEWRGKLRVPWFNRYTVGPFIRLYHAAVLRQPRLRRVPLYDFLFPVHDKTLYFQLFGTRGFHECQFVIPHGSFTSFAAELRACLRRRAVPITLASAKLFGGRRDLLRFSGSGICLALDFPRTQEGLELARNLDALLHAHGGWPNAIKDSRLTSRVIAATYPEYDLFRRRLREFDPRRLYRSEMSERLEL